ncbi:MAG: PAS domain-containing protein, partial [Geminicoccaceae bacterium]
KDIVRQLDTHEETYVTTLSARIDAISDLASVRGEIYAEGLALQDRLAPLFLDSSLALIGVVDSAGDPGLLNADRLPETLNEVQLFTEIGFAAERFLHVATQSDAGRLDILAPLSREEIAPEFRHLAQLTLKLGDEHKRLAIAGSLNLFEEKALGTGGVADLVDVLIETTKRLERLSQQRAILLGRMTDVIDDIVNDARGRFFDGAKSAERSSLTAVLALTVFSIIAFAAVIWIGWRLINRDIAQRLDRLSTSTIALAAGDLDVTIDQSGSDELAEMGRAAEIFRQNALELRQAEAELADQLIEVQGANERLQKANEALDLVNAELAESDLRYQLAIDGSSVGIWDWDAQTDELFWSDRLKQMLGLSGDDFEANLDFFVDCLHPDDRTLVTDRRIQHLQSGQDYDVECRLRRKDGDYVWIRNRGQAVWDGLGNPKRMAGSADDITERKLAEIKLNDYAHELERSNHELDQFAYIASHDLKEPLRALYNHARFLLEDYQDKLESDGEKRLHRIIKLSERMEKLIADLLYFSRLGRGDQTMDVLDLNNVIAEVEADLKETLTARNATIDVRQPLPPVSGHPAHMKALFQNLISNGTRYNDADEKVIEIGQVPRAGEKQPFLETLYVRDNGIGIEELFKTDVFRLFKRLNDDKAYGEGSGAGLTFVKKIVENHGGTIWLESTAGQGTTFYFTLKKAT